MNLLNGPVPYPAVMEEIQKLIYGCQALSGEVVMKNIIRTYPTTFIRENILPKDVMTGRIA
jgi:hypothetical protein